jgi:hypothetical protein
MQKEKRNKTKQKAALCCAAALVGRLMGGSCLLQDGLRGGGVTEA